MNKYMITLTVSALFSIGTLAKIENPTLNSNGYQNVNSRKEYDYSPYPNEKIWHEFGRPYWRTEATPQAKAAPKKEVKEMKKVSSFMDDDKDSISNEADHCPNTPQGHKVNSLGCSMEAKERITLDVKFTLNKSNILPDFTSDIDKLASSLKNNKDLRIEIQGHTDTTGTTAFNKILSQSRSNAVKQYLIRQHGIAPSRLEAKGYGPEAPVADNSTLAGRKLNRRVEIKIIK